MDASSRKEAQNTQKRDMAKKASILLSCFAILELFHG
jgi:hypothetical protein